MDDTYKLLVRSYAERHDAHCWTDPEFVHMRLPSADLATVVRAIPSGDVSDVLADVDAIRVRDAVADVLSSPSDVLLKSLRDLYVLHLRVIERSAVRRFAHAVACEMDVLEDERSDRTSLLRDSDYLYDEMPSAFLRVQA